MYIQYHKKFEKRFTKLTPQLKQKVKKCIERFDQNPFDTQLRNHALTGKLIGKRAISVMGDMRIIFEEQNNYVLVIMLDVGTHNQVY
jgi:addiction module RelE/StbE family toxin